MTISEMMMLLMGRRRKSETSTPHKEVELVVEDKEELSEIGVEPLDDDDAALQKRRIARIRVFSYERT